MTTTFDRIVIAVPELAAAVADYQQIFAIAPCIDVTAQGEPAASWGLANTVIELVQSAVNEPQIQGLVLASPDAVLPEASVKNSLGLDIRSSDGRAIAAFRQQQTDAQCTGWSVDHVVLRTKDAQGCIELFSEQLGIRLALDKTVPEWGGRMLFFRAGKLTLEVIESTGDNTSSNFFWGLAYQCPDLTQVVQAFEARGVAVSAIREGRKPGTLVATLKSHCLDIPTLLIQPAK